MIHPEGTGGFSRPVGVGMRGKRPFCQNGVNIFRDQSIALKKKFWNFLSSAIGKSRCERGGRYAQKISENSKKKYFEAKEVFRGTFSGCLPGRADLPPASGAGGPGFESCQGSKFFEKNQIF